MQKNDALYSGVKNRFNYHLHPCPGEVNKLPSMTVPDQALDLKEIIRRFAAGIPLDVGKMPVFDEDNDLPDFSKMDLADRQAYAEQFQEELNEIKSRLKPRETQPSDKDPVLPQGTAQGGASSPGQNSERSDGGLVSAS